ncbi:hypothetical protein GA0115253_1023011 [Streptomyces sp. Termitarium-T10T-6]|nr:hypothetical protein GA0115253_1023011 [Streptomyces sp. Termitarium-T10T-6]
MLPSLNVYGCSGHRPSPLIDTTDWSTGLPGSHIRAIRLPGNSDHRMARAGTPRQAAQSMHVGQVRHQPTTAHNAARTVRARRQCIQGDDRFPGRIGGSDRITTPQHRHPVLRTVGTRLVLDRRLVRALFHVTPHPRRASRQARPRRTAVGQTAPARQAAQNWVWPSHALYVASPLSLRLLPTRLAPARGRVVRSFPQGVGMVIRSPQLPIWRTARGWMPGLHVTATACSSSRFRRLRPSGRSV